MADTPVAEMSLEEMEKEFIALAPEFARISDRRNALDAEIQQRQKFASAKERVSAMSEADKEALRKALEK